MEEWLELSKFVSTQVNLGSYRNFAKRLAQVERQVKNTPWFDVFNPTLRRLQFLLASGLDHHKFLAVFLTGSLSWGRFYAVSDSKAPPSDIDLLVVVEDFQSIIPTKFAMLIAEPAMQELSSLIKNMPTGHNIDCVVFHCTAKESDIELSLTIASRAGFMNMIAGGSNQIVSWRAKKLGSDHIVMTNLAGQRREIILEEIETPHGYLLYLPSWPLTIYDWFPTPFQQLILPIAEYVGNCDEAILGVVRNLASEASKIIFGAGVSDGFWHCRHSRMPPWVSCKSLEYIQRGPRRIF